MKNDKRNLNFKILEILSTALYSGKSPKAPGTCGSFITLPIVYIIAYFYGIYGILTFAIFVFIIGIPVADAYAKAINKKDPGEIVIDEVAGQAITLLVAGTNIYLYLIGFILFRLFDISKPFPVSWADTKVPGGLGIMLDDILAGLIGAVILWEIKTYLF